MIQLNLLPGIKAEYVKAQRTKRTVVSISLITAAVAIGVVGLLASVAYGAQALQLNDLEKKINNNVSEIKKVTDLDKILTIQNQLVALTPLHEAKPVMARIFTYIQQTTPQSVSVDTLSVSNEDYSWSIEGSAPSFELINKYVDTLKFTEIQQAEEGADKVYAFKEVVLSDFMKSDQGYTYTINLKFNEQLFSSSNPDIKLVVPTITTTRSQTQLPSDQIFAPNPEAPQEEQ